MYEDLCLATQPRDMDLKKIGNESGKDRFALEGHKPHAIEAEYFLKSQSIFFYLGTCNFMNYLEGTLRGHSDPSRRGY